jgi:two-component system, LytTR family, sensor histidine kinase AlgZ
METQQVQIPAAAGGAEAVLKARRQTDGADAPVLPDCCNTGVALQILLVANLFLLLYALAVSASLATMGSRVLLGAAVLEPTVLLTLIVVCAVRRWTNQLDRVPQWFIAAGVPMLIVAGICLTVQYMFPSLGDDGGYWVVSRAVLAGVVSLCLAQYFRYRTLARAPSISEARLQALQARIRPHFLFNSLNTVLGLLRTDPRRAEETLENLAELFRVFMRDTLELVSLADELETCRQYLYIEQLRLGSRLIQQWEIEAAPGDGLLPSLLLQPLVENAVHHGIEPRSEPGIVHIRITNPSERVRVEIRNPLNPEPTTRRGNQMALSNVRERLRLLYDIEAELKTMEQDGLFVLIVEFPYRKERRRRNVRPNHSPAS